MRFPSLHGAGQADPVQELVLSRVIELLRVQVPLLFLDTANRKAKEIIRASRDLSPKSKLGEHFRGEWVGAVRYGRHGAFYTFFRISFNKVPPDLWVLVFIVNELSSLPDRNHHTVAVGTPRG